MRLNKKWFNPLYFILNDIIKDDTVRTVLVYGGKSSSKTVSIAQVLAKECQINEASTISYRKESAIIKTTLKKSFELAINSMFLNPTMQTLDLSFRCDNKSEIIMKGLDDPEKAKGIESYKYVYLDELNHFELSEYEQFNLSLRGKRGQKIFASWNPVDELSWVKTDLVDKYEFFHDTKYKLPSPNSFVKRSACGKVILIRTTYEDNYWITGSPCGTYGYKDQNLIDEYESLRTKNYESYKVNVLGLWGKTTFGGEFIKQWRSEKHTGIYKYNPELALYLSFDENVNPYFPCGFFQVEKDNKTSRMVHAIAAKNPDNTTSSMCREITRKLNAYDHKEHLYIGGDATSKKEDVKQEKGHDLFKLLMNGLESFKPIRKVATSNPSVRTSGDFFNEVLENNYEGLNFGVDKDCHVAIKDYEYTKEDKNGHIDKSTVKDINTKVSYQPYGHFVDLTRYFLVNTFHAEYYKYQFRNKAHQMTGGKNVSPNNW